MLRSAKPHLTWREVLQFFFQGKHFTIWQTFNSCDIWQSSQKKEINNDGTLSSFYYSLLFFSLQTRAYDNNVFAIWIEMLQSIEEKASNYYTQLQELEKEILKDLKKLKANKTKRMKNFNDRVSTLQKELEFSVTEVCTNLHL